MIAMGFSPELAQEAVNRSPPDSLEQAVEYCFNHPNNSVSSGPSSVREALEHANMVRAALRATATGTSGQSQPVIEQQAEALSSSSSVGGSGDVEAMMPEAGSGQEEEEAVHQLDKQILDKFASTMLPGLVKILDNVPDTVYRVCELIVVVAKKYGEGWRDKSLAFILEEICELIRQVCGIYKKSEAEVVLETSTSYKSKCFCGGGVRGANTISFVYTFFLVRPYVFISHDISIYHPFWL